ncbi:fungal-specific transcription factor domain-containing protein [Apodospora peruviana]|uniref:Fungal-specific transcription factor domain-containing protein n=1 Tax=Apodospora peruviana TaxID=516989 RepID=A0AAE0HWY8_9PEZI|nr:fungal-specific transcription factor domain-containing protein [Apodospora peruviana]
MFTTFVTTSTAASTTPGPRSGESSTSNTNPSATPPTASAPTTTSAPVVRQKRSQVARACDWCRVHRIKCDNEQPCFNCRTRGGHCSNKGATEIRTLPHAFREIERLRQRVQDLEKEVEKRDQVIASHNDDPVVVAPPASQAPPIPARPSAELNAWGEPGRVSRHIEGIFMSTSQLPQKQWFGPSSLFYFIGRIHAYLAVALQQTQTEQTNQIHVTNKPLTSASPERDVGASEDAPVLDPRTYDKRFLSPTQEEFFLDLFWQSYHCSLQIVDEVSFKEHYRSLWTDGNTRKPSALVDIILALSMQQGIPARARPPGSDRSTAPRDETDIDASWHYKRCQALLVSELECPTLSTLQSQIFSIVYLCCCSCQNMAHSNLALAIRTAHILGLHLEPNYDLPRPERELRKRIWWTLYYVESKTCMKLGRPWSTTLSEATCTLPADDHQLAIQSGCSVAGGGNVTWLTYTVQNTKLVLAARAVYTAFYQKIGLVLAESAGASVSLSENPAGLETCAAFLRESMQCLDVWQRGVPEVLKNRRKDSGVPFSTDCTPLTIEIFAPAWMQRHRLWLELLYHNYCINLFRTFICFNFSPSVSAGSTPLSDECAACCVKHAVALTHIIHQVLSETDLLNGWHEAFQWQWNAALTMVGYVLAFPAGAATAVAREGIDIAVLAFNILSRNFAVSTSAASVTRDLTNKADLIRSRPRPFGGYAAGGQHVVAGDGSDMAAADLQAMLTGSMDLASLVDGSFDNLEYLSPPNNVNMADLWMST